MAKFRVEQSRLTEDKLDHGIRGSKLIRETWNTELQDGKFKSLSYQLCITICSNISCRSSSPIHKRFF